MNIPETAPKTFSRRDEFLDGLIAIGTAMVEVSHGRLRLVFEEESGTSARDVRAGHFLKLSRDGVYSRVSLDFEAYANAIALGGIDIVASEFRRSICGILGDHALHTCAQVGERKLKELVEKFHSRKTCTA